MSITTSEITELHEDHAAIVDALHAVFGPDADELVAKVEHRYNTTLGSWRDCVDRVVAEHVRTRCRYSGG